MTTVETLLKQHPDKGEFAKTYRGAPTEARTLLNALIDYALEQHPDIRVYPTNTPDLRVALAGRVRATIEIKKRKPHLRMYLRDIRNPLPNTRLSFKPSPNKQLKTYVEITDLTDFDDATRYLDRTLQTGSESRRPSMKKSTFIDTVSGLQVYWPGDGLPELEFINLDQDCTIATCLEPSEGMPLI